MLESLNSTLASLQSRYTYDDRTGRYRAPSGRFVSMDTVRRALDQALSSMQGEGKALAVSLMEGRIDLPTWQSKMVGIIKNVHLVSGALQKGGWAQMTLGDFGQVGNLIRRQYSFLERLAFDLESGRQRLDGSLLSRVDMYFQAARETYHLVEMASMRRDGFIDCRRVLAASDHCTDEDGPGRGCLELAQETAEWIPLDEMVPIGRANCIVRCKCQLEYRNPTTGEIRSPVTRL